MTFFVKISIFCESYLGMGRSCLGFLDIPNLIESAIQYYKDDLMICFEAAQGFVLTMWSLSRRTR